MKQKPTHEIHEHNGEAFKFSASSDNAALSKALTLAARAKKSGEWTVYVLPEVEGGFPEAIFSVRRDRHRTVEVWRVTVS